MGRAARAAGDTGPPENRVRVSEMAMPNTTSTDCAHRKLVVVDQLDRSGVNWEAVSEGRKQRSTDAGGTRWSNARERRAKGEVVSLTDRRTGKMVPVR